MVLLRGYSPKGEDISGIFDSQIQEWANKLNTRPRNLTIEAIKKPLKSTFVNLNGFLEIQFLSAFYHITAFVS